jgi:Kdo2-lipid IVA lauroyltransferase/acyltransferase
MILFSYLLYYLVIIPISLLPFPLLYLLSDFLFFILHSLLGYRKKIVVGNISNSFPEKSKHEINEITKLFYKHFCDVIVESLKSFTISDAQISKRMILKNPELLNKYYDNKQSVILAGGHYNNWEWIAVALDKQMKHQSIAIYKTLSNKFFDEKMRSTRGKFGLLMVSTKLVAETFSKFKNELTATIFAIDQSPSNPKKCYWMNFLNQDTPVLFGTEKFAKDYNQPVLFGTITKVKRGFYQIAFETVTDNPTNTEHGYITETTTKLLEAEIIKAPQYWLWTHRRWKHKR